MTKANYSVIQELLRYTSGHMSQCTLQRLMCKRIYPTSNRVLGYDSRVDDVIRMKSRGKDNVDYLEYVTFFFATDDHAF